MILIASLTGATTALLFLRSGRPSKARNQNHTKLLQSILAMQNDKNGGRVRLKDIQNMLAKDFNK
jgi:hypothetical protein